MEAERWGTLSVKDHLDAQALIADLLLYDRSVPQNQQGTQGNAR
jgi:hypothetical protein